MITAQVVDFERLDFVAGKPVKIKNAPPDTNFILVPGEFYRWDVFSIDTGMICSHGDTQNAAKKNAEQNFLHYSLSPDFMDWWRAAVLLKYSYLNQIWSYARYCHLSQHIGIEKLKTNRNQHLF